MGGARPWEPKMARIYNFHLPLPAVPTLGRGEGAETISVVIVLMPFSQGDYHSGLVGVSKKT